MHALVTGAAGFIGAHLMRYLAGRGWRVRALDVHAPPEPAPAGVDFRVLDISDEAALTASLRDITHVFNLASVHLDVQASYGKFAAVNVRALERLIELSARAHVQRLIQVSSVGVYGHVTRPPAAEDAPLRPQNDYERTKAAGELAAQRAAARTGLDVVIIRPSWVYGSGCPRTAKLLRSLRSGRFFYMGPATNLRHPIFIDDMLLALELAARADASIAGRTFNIAGPRWMSVKEMVEEFARAAGVPPPRLHVPRWVGLVVGYAAERVGALLRIEPPVSRRTLAFFENDNAFDTAAARLALGFQPRIELSEGARSVAQSRPSLALNECAREAGRA